MFGSKGKIDIAIQKTNYAPGDTVSGNVALTLKKPVKAREVSISLIGTAWVTTYSGTRTGGFNSPMPSGGGMMMGRRRGGIGGMGMQKSTMKQRANVYDFKQELDGEREYSEGRRYRFEIKIPEDILSMRSQMPNMGPIKWYLSAKLDIPGGLDVSKKVDITIG